MKEVTIGHHKPIYKNTRILDERRDYYQLVEEVVEVAEVLMIVLTERVSRDSNENWLRNWLILFTTRLLSRPSMIDLTKSIFEKDKTVSRKIPARTGFGAVFSR